MLYCAVGVASALAMLYGVVACWAAARQVRRIYVALARHRSQTLSGAPERLATSLAQVIL
jgi:hypothetical protein